MKKLTLTLIAILIAAGVAAFFWSYKQGGSEFQAYEQRLSSGDVEAAARRLSELKAQYDKDAARINELDAVK